MHTEGNIICVCNFFFHTLGWVNTNTHTHTQVQGGLHRNIRIMSTHTHTHYSTHPLYICYTDWSQLKRRTNDPIKRTPPYRTYNSIKNKHILYMHAVFAQQSVYATYRICVWMCMHVCVYACVCAVLCLCVCWWVHQEKVLLLCLICGDVEMCATAHHRSLEYALVVSRSIAFTSEITHRSIVQASNPLLLSERSIFVHFDKKLRSFYNKKTQTTKSY